MQAKHPCGGTWGGLRVQKAPSKGHGGPNGGSCDLSVVAAPRLHNYIPTKCNPLQRMIGRKKAGWIGKEKDEREKQSTRMQESGKT